MTPTRWIVFAVIAIITLGGLVALSNKEKIDVSSVDINAIVTSGDKADQVYGNPKAKVVLIEYADFQCPGCAGAYPNLRVIKELYKDQVAFVYRHFPLTSIHPNALAAAAVAEAAGQQGKFWDMHDLLYGDQSSWVNVKSDQRGATFDGYATQLGLDLTRFNTDLGSKKVSTKIAYDRAIAGKAKVDSTPTFFLNGNKLSADTVTDVVQQKGTSLKTQLDAAIKAAGGTVPVTKAQ